MTELRRIFVSYARDDGDRARQLVKVLNSYPRFQIHQVIDIAPRANLLDELIGRVQQSDALVAILSPRYLRSPWSHFELGAGWGARKPIFAVSEDKALAEKLALLRASNIIADSGDPDEVAQKVLRRIDAAVKEARERTTERGKATRRDAADVAPKTRRSRTGSKSGASALKKASKKAGKANLTLEESPSAPPSPKPKAGSPKKK